MLLEIKPQNHSEITLACEVGLKYHINVLHRTLTNLHNSYISTLFQTFFIWSDRNFNWILKMHIFDRSNFFKSFAGNGIFLMPICCLLLFYVNIHELFKNFKLIMNVWEKGQPVINKLSFF